MNKNVFYDNLLLCIDYIVYASFIEIKKKQNNNKEPNNYSVLIMTLLRSHFLIYDDLYFSTYTTQNSITLELFH